MTRAAPNPITTCDRCGMFFPHKHRLSLLSIVEGRLSETTWLCYLCGIVEGGVPATALPLIAELLERPR